MIKNVNAIIVVEGKTDVSFLQEFIKSEFVITNGSAVSRETLDYLKEASKHKEIIILTDPDFPGKQIRDTIAKEIPNAKHAFVRKEVSIKHGKVGVAESTKDEVLKALDGMFSLKSENNSSLSQVDLYKLGLIGQENSKKLRKILEDKFSLGFCNGKTLKVRLNSLNITYNQLEEALKNEK